MIIKDICLDVKFWVLEALVYSALISLFDDSIKWVNETFADLGDGTEWKCIDEEITYNFFFDLGAIFTYAVKEAIQPVFYEILQLKIFQENSRSTILPNILDNEGQNLCLFVSKIVKKELSGCDMTQQNKGPIDNKIVYLISLELV